MHFIGLNVQSFYADIYDIYIIEHSLLNRRHQVCQIFNIIGAIR